MTKINRLKLLVIVLFATPMIICGQGQPVLVKNPTASPVPVNIVAGSITNSSTTAAVTNVTGTVLGVREQRDISTNAIIGGNIGVTNFPASLSQTNSSGILKTDPSNFTNGTINLPTGASTAANQATGNSTLASILIQLAAGLGITNFPSLFPATQSTSPWVVSGTVNSTGTVAVTQSTVPWVTTGSVTQAGAPWNFTGAVTQAGAPWATTGSVNITSGTVNATNSPVSLFHLSMTASTNTNIVKTGAGVLYFVHPMNVTSTAYYIHLFDRNSQPITNSTRLIQVQAAVAGSGGGLHSDYQPFGIPFSNGLAIATSLTSSETNLSAIATAGSGVDIGYK